MTAFAAVPSKEITLSTDFKHTLFGAQVCSLQVKVQTRNIDEARELYCQLLFLSPCWGLYSGGFKRERMTFTIHSVYNKGLKPHKDLH